MIKTVARALLLIGLIAAPTQGCGGSAEADGSDSRTPWDAAKPKLADANCDLLKPCCNDSGYGFDKTRCLAQAGEFYRGIDPLIASGVVQFDAASADACIEALKTGAFDCAKPETEPEPCTKVFVGKRQLGEECDRQQECAPGLYCFNSAGRCAKDPPRGKQGDACQATCFMSETGKVCNGGSFESEPAECFVEDNLRCSDQGICEPAYKEGDDCGFNFCGAGLYCTAASMKCAKLQTEGQPCDTYDACIAGLYCDQTAQVCTKRIGLGMPCDDNESCAAGSGCFDGACRLDATGPNICGAT